MSHERTLLNQPINNLRKTQKIQVKSTQTKSKFVKICVCVQQVALVSLGVHWKEPQIKMKTCLSQDRKRIKKVILMIKVTIIVYLIRNKSNESIVKLIRRRVIRMMSQLTSTLLTQNQLKILSKTLEISKNQKSTLEKAIIIKHQNQQMPQNYFQRRKRARNQI